MATHSSILAWRIPWTEETGGLQSMGAKRVVHDSVTNTHILCPQAPGPSLLHVHRGFQLNADLLSSPVGCLAPVIPSLFKHLTIYLVSRESLIPSLHPALHTPLGHHQQAPTALPAPPGTPYHRAGEASLRCITLGTQDTPPARLRQDSAARSRPLASLPLLLPSWPQTSPSRQRSVFSEPLHDFPSAAMTKHHNLGG